MNGKVLNLPSHMKVEFDAIPEINSKLRKPLFKCKVNVNEENSQLDPNVSLFTKIVGFRKERKESLVFGSCNVALANLEGWGHQVVLKRAMTSDEYEEAETVKS